MYYNVRGIRMSLETKLAAIREMAKSRIPPAALATMHRATEAQHASGILNSVVKVGATLPEFSLRSARGALITSSELLRRGPLVLSIFRGHW
jgi:hypothetical protein